MYERYLTNIRPVTKACNFPDCTYTLTKTVIETPHDRCHDNLRAVAGLILLVNSGGKKSREYIRDTIDESLTWTRRGHLDLYQNYLVSFYGREFDLLSLHLPWTPNEKHWSPMTILPSYTSIESSVADTMPSHTSVESSVVETIPSQFLANTACNFCKKKVPNRRCQLCRVREW